MQPFWSSFADSTGGVQRAGGKPSLIHINTLRRVPFALTITVWAFCGVWWALSQRGLEDMSISGIAGRSPLKRTRPLMDPAVAGSTWAAGRLAAASVFGC